MVKTSPNTVEKDLDWSSFPSLPADFPPNTFEAAIKATKTSKPDVYTVDLKRDWCIGLGISPTRNHDPMYFHYRTNTNTVPQGGYTTSILTSALSIYMSTTHPTLNQTHPITIHAEFLARTAVGPALVRITPLKLGRQFSTLRVQLLQPPSTQNPKICIEAIVMQGNLSSPFSNLHLATRPRVEKVPRREDFEEGVVQEQWLGLRPALFKFEKRFPNGANVYGVSEGLGKSVREQWVSWGGGRKFGVQALGFLADAWRPIPEAYGLMGMW